MGSNIITKKLPSQEEIKERFFYDGKNLLWKKTIFKENLGKVAGNISRNGYRTIHMYNNTVYAHRLIWVYVYGSLDGFVDHVNHDKLDNSLSNLRVVTTVVNSKNMPGKSNGNTPFIGVGWNKRTNMWRVSLKHNKREVHLGYYKDLHEAISMRLTANEHYGYHENHGLL